MKKRNPIYTAGSFLLAGALTLSMAACSGAQAPAEVTQTPSATATPAATAAPAEETIPSAPVSGALPVKALQPKQVDENPYMAKSDANIHHDGYNTDSTDEILPLGIYTAITPIQPTRSCRSASIRRSMSPMRRQTRMRLPPFTLTATAMQSFRCSAASPSAI